MEDDTSKNETETETPENETEKSDEKKSKDLQSALAQKEHFREKFETAQERLKQLQETVASFTEKQKEETRPSNSEIGASTNPMELVRLNKALEGYSEEEVEFIIKNAPNKTIDGVINASKDEWVGTAISGMREKADKDKKVPSPSSRAPAIGGKTVTDMTEQEKQTNFPELIRQAVAKRKGGRTSNI